jgi:hypothetical protein
MKKVVIFLLFLMVMINNSHAATWVKLSENSNSKLMFDKQSVLEKDTLKRAWIKIVYKTPQKSAQAADKDFNLSKVLWYFDCTAQKSATAAAWLDHGDLAVAAGLDLVLVRGGEEEARAENPLGEPITAVATVPGGVAIAGAGPRVVLHFTVARAERPTIDVPPGGGRSLQVGDGLLVTGTRSLGERVVVHDLTSGDQLATIRGVATAAAAGGVVVGTGREGTVVLAR